MGGDRLMQIGEVAEHTCLSLRTIRYYEEVGLVVPAARSQGGFRLYSQADVRRLLMVRRLKPLDLSLEEIRQLLATVELAEATDGTSAQQRESLRSRLVAYRSVADARGAALRDELAGVEEIAAVLSGYIDHVTDHEASVAPRD